MRAYRRLLLGCSPALLTAVCVVDADGEWEHLEVARLSMRPLSRHRVEAYVARDQPLDCAGSYKLEAAGIGEKADGSLVR